MDCPPNHRILIVDDSRAIQDDFRKILAPSTGETELNALEAVMFGERPAAPPEEPFEVDSAFQGREALARVAEAAACDRRYALAFVDLRMPPGWDGLETIEALWKVDPELQIVLCTAYSDQSWLQLRVRFGASDRLLILKKPFDTVEVRQLACALTERGRRERQARLEVGRLEARLRHDALHDPLTGLANRALLVDRIGQCLGRARRSAEERYAVLFMDLDRLQLINDSLGHVVGDQVLIGVAERLVRGLRSTDSVAHLDESQVARLGGDEFVVLLEGLRVDVDALRVASRLQESLKAPFDLDGKQVFASISIGIALGRPEYERPEQLLSDAGTALGQAKAHGRGCIEVFDSTAQLSAMSRWWIENERRRALEEGESSPVAPVRWQHPESDRLASDV